MAEVDSYTAASQAAALVVYGGAAVASRTSSVRALTVYQAESAARTSAVGLLASYVPPQARATRLSQIAALVPYDVGVHVIPRASQAYELVVWGTGVASEFRSRAWTFVLDGHTFYVLDLGVEGTFLYDIATEQWCEFRTEGHPGWNMRNGLVWGETGRIVAGDMNNDLVWELVPDTPLDDGFRGITHATTGGVMLRSRVHVGVSALRVAGSIGTLGEDSTTLRMRFSDDWGRTWSDDFVVELVQGEFDGEVAWRSLGSFMAPGRVFEFEDLGGMLRIDGVDVYLDGFDGENDD